MTTSCRREREVWQAATAGRWTRELADHAASCAACRDVREVTHALAAPVAGAVKVPAPKVLWMAARSARRVRAASQIALLTSATYLVIAIGLVGAGLFFAGSPSTWFKGGDSPSAPIGLWTGVAVAVMAAGLVALSRWVQRGESVGS